MTCALVCLWLPVSPLWAQDQGTNELPQTEVRNYGDWAVRCDPSGRDGRPDCEMFQRLTVANGQQFLLFRIVKNVGGEASDPPVDIAVISTPLGVHLPSGITLAVDGGRSVRVDYESCTSKGCFAGFPFSDTLQQAFRRGVTCRVAVRLLSGDTVNVDVSLRGFTVAYTSF